ncbi:MAG: hypothetical protein JNM81_08770 [Rhodospirillaceae bacterium]|nr:hypothetical protein [Rhodospirillaceae bacterium]
MTRNFLLAGFAAISLASTSGVLPVTAAELDCASPESVGMSSKGLADVKAK